MVLILSVVSYKGQPAAQPRTERFTDPVITIGRAAGNSWILPDPENYLSKQHCVIARQGGGYEITDRSSNGTFLNFSGEPLGRDRKAPLNDGDRLRIGDYDLLVRIVAQEATMLAPGGNAAPGPARPASAPPVDAADPFGLQNLMGTPAAAPPAAPLLAEPPLDLDALFPSNPLFEPVPAGGMGAASVPPPVFDEAPQWLPEPPAPSASPWQPTPHDHAPAEQASFRVPTSAPTTIPEDWDPLSPLAPAGPPGAAPGMMPPNPIPVPPPAPRVAAPVASVGPPARAAADGALLEAFLEGAGLPAAIFNGEDPALSLRRLGQIVREMVGGLSQLLETRAMLKTTYRVEQTVVRANNNNPLKFSPNAEEALALLLGPARPGYMPGVRAVSESIKDLKAHEFALMAGMQSAVIALLRQFDPEQLKQRLDKQSLLQSVVPGARKAKYWEVYEQQYREIAGDVSENVRGVFGRAFAQAYEEQVKKL